MIKAHVFNDYSFRGWRAKPRKAMRLQISALVQTGGALAIVRDLSEHGLRLETDADLSVSDLLEVKLPMSEHMLAEVVWSERGSYGCKLSRPIPKSVVSALLSPVEHAPLRNDERLGVIDEFLDQTKPQASDRIWYGKRCFPATLRVWLSGADAVGHGRWHLNERTGHGDWSGPGAWPAR